ncbi:MAG: sulfatase [Pirellulaceae bacterium]
MCRRVCFVLSCAALIALGLIGSSPVAAQDAAQRPNVLFIAVDDLRPDLGCYGHPEAKTPHIDALASRGMVFRRAYCQQAVCSPTRTSLLTGLRPDSTKVYDLETHFRDTIPNVVTLPQYFKSNGYHSAGMGKIYHGGLDDAKSWSEPHQNPGGAGYVLAENKQRIAAGKAQGKAAGKKGKALNRAGRGAAFEMADVPDNAYADGSLAEMAVAKLGELKAKQQPFFLAVGFVKPHLPFNAPKKYFDLYDPVALRLAANPQRPKDAPPFAITDFGELRSYHGIPKEGPLDEPLARQLVHAYRAATSFTDANVGRLLAELDRLGLRENTIVILWGDHGWKLGEHGGWCKHTNVENDTRSPLILAAPAKMAATQPAYCDRLVEFVDIYPTLCDLAGLPLPKHLQGTSMQPLLGNPALPWKSAAFSQYPRMHAGRRLMGYALRTDRYRYVEWQDRKSKAIVAQELYDHQTDPAENENVAVRAANKDLLAKLSAQLAAGWQGAKPK